ncbi:fimbrillin family protein [Bacteroides fragilis]
MQKISSFTTAMVVFLMFFTSCTNEELLPHEPVWDQGRIVFNVNTGKNVVCTRAPEENEQAIRSLGVFIVKPDGNLAEGITRFYEAKALTDKKTCRFYPGRHNGNSRCQSLPGG